MATKPSSVSQALCLEPSAGMRLATAGGMHKAILNNVLDGPSDAAWLDLSDASVEISSEDPAHPIEGALVGRQGRGWRAAGPGKQTIRITFDRPRRISRIGIEFEENEVERSQEFSISWCAAPGAPWREALRQQWNFSPGGATSETEDYAVNLDGVALLKLEIDPDRGGNTAHASLKRLRVA